MKKSPEEYFSEQNFSADSPEPGVFTPAELAFMEKYMGVDSADILGQLGLPAVSSPATDGQAEAPKQSRLSPEQPRRQGEESAKAKLPGPAGAASAEVPAAGPAALPQEESEERKEEKSLEAFLKSEPQIQMVGFFISGQEFTIPTVSVQEVIRFLPVAKLPAAPDFVAGVINLRGRVTPLLELRSILEVHSPRKEEDKFIIVCRCKGLQVGMIIERVHTMYRVSQEDIEWGIEAHLGVNAEYIAGLFKLREKLVSIVSVDRVVAGVLK